VVATQLEWGGAALLAWQEAGGAQAAARQLYSCARVEAAAEASFSWPTVGGAEVAEPDAPVLARALAAVEKARQDGDPFQEIIAQDYEQANS